VMVGAAGGGPGGCGGTVSRRQARKSKATETLPTRRMFITIETDSTPKP
jgi:hypothetical protein